VRAISYVKAVYQMSAMSVRVRTVSCASKLLEVAGQLGAMAQPKARTVKPRLHFQDLGQPEKLVFPHFVLLANLWQLAHGFELSC
jgi:hypothetical protein